ncbi:unnamed protein product [Soboliphyme baturini]|uniref:Arrestin_N domain-containing protein n=1 Tax=Soboliphyme baturini TaxID=241478 RepID=A0A183I8X3_9BILA|nr:unnamed protein product [Soboliphyme baturini]
MELLDSFDISFQSKQSLFFAGSSVRGEVVAVLNQAVRSANLHVALKGESHTHWVNKVSENINDSVEPLIDRILQLSLQPKSADGSDHPSLLPAGCYTVPFRLNIPEALPSTIEGEFGYVRYVCTASLELTPTIGGSGKRVPPAVVSKNVTIFANVKKSVRDACYACTVLVSLYPSIRLSLCTYWESKRVLKTMRYSANSHFIVERHNNYPEQSIVLILFSNLAET